MNSNSSFKELCKKAELKPESYYEKVTKPKIKSGELTLRENGKILKNGRKSYSYKYAPTKRIVEIGYITGIKKVEICR